MRAKLVDFDHWAPTICVRCGLSFAAHVGRASPHCDFDRGGTPCEAFKAADGTRLEHRVVVVEYAVVVGGG